MQEELRRGGLWPRTIQLDVVDLDVVEPRHLAQQAQPLAGASKRGGNALAVADRGRRQLVDAVDLPGSQSNCLTEAGVLHVVPRVPDRGKACLDVTGGRVAEALERIGHRRPPRVGRPGCRERRTGPAGCPDRARPTPTPQAGARACRRAGARRSRARGRTSPRRRVSPADRRAGTRCGGSTRWGHAAGRRRVLALGHARGRPRRRARARVRPTRSGPAAGFEEPSRAGAARRRPMRSARWSLQSGTGSAQPFLSQDPRQSEVREQAAVGEPGDRRIRSPSSVRTTRPTGRAISVWAVGK